jgi:hypothetical protein
MGILDNVLSIFGASGSDSESKKVLPFKLTTSLRPVRLRAMAQNSCDLIITIQNLEQKQLMCSVVVESPNS